MKIEVGLGLVLGWLWLTRLYSSGLFDHYFKHFRAVPHTIKIGISKSDWKCRDAMRRQLSTVEFSQIINCF